MENCQGAFYVIYVFYQVLLFARLCWLTRNHLRIADIIDMFRVSHTVLPASLTLSPDKCDPGGSRPGVPPPEEGERASSFPNPYADNEELGGRWNGEGNCYSISKTVQFVPHICINET